MCSSWTKVFLSIAAASAFGTLAIALVTAGATETTAIRPAASAMFGVLAAASMLTGAIAGIGLSLEHAADIFAGKR